MRKFLLFLITVLSFTVAQSQVSEVDALLAKQLVAKNSAAAGLTPQDQDNTLVSSTYTTMDGLRMVYLQQTHLGIPVYNQLQVMAFKNESLVSNAGGRIPGIQKMTRTDGRPTVSVVTALETALADAKAKALEAAIPIFTSTDGQSFEFGKLGATTENIKANLLWYPLEGKNEVKLVWQIFVTPRGSSDYWLIRVDANTNTVVDRTNLTITCNWDPKGHSVETHMKDNHTKVNTDNYVTQKKEKTFNIRPDVINSVTYRVIKHPAESPSHPGGAPALHTDPWLMAGAPAASLGWHDDGTILHDSTRGNNVWAQEDRDANNGTFGKTAVSTTPQPTLTLDWTYDFTKSPIDITSDNQKAAITNLFYWNNIIHDIAYVYGFDEPTGNFQANNQGRGGAGADYVIGDAQDASGANNANFSTPVDGSRPRMQMFLWTAPNPDRDGDLDNGIVVHEYAHGISNRYTGGPATTSCLGNSEQGGEGWSDYFALMSTTNWATATVNDGVFRRGIGTYALNQPTTGVGIRNFPYSTDMSIYPQTYANLPATGGQPHNVGEIWCMMIWEMTWAIIQQDNAINPNLFAPGPLATMVGNSSALKLVSEGMRLQPCNPGFVDARNAILRADTLLFNARYSCSIWKAFAKRGLGRYASQGSASSAADGTADFTVDASAFRVNENITTVPEGQNVTYTNTITAGNCTPVVNFFITDTLPTNVTYVSGGSYNAGNRTITFSAVTLAANASGSFPFTVTVNPGSYFSPVTHFNETVAAPGIPSAWTPSSTTATAWTTSAVSSNSAPNSFFAPDPVIASDHRLATTGDFTLSPGTVSNYSTLSFWHRFNTEDGWDGGVVEISTNGGGSWTDLGSKMITGKYNGSMGTGSNNPIGGRAAFTGLIASFMKTTINLSSYAGQAIKIRFRFGSDDNTAPAGGGWFVDDIVLYTEPAVVIKSNLLNASGVFQSSSDTLTRITQVSVCVPATITNQPATVNACTGGTAVFTVTAAGTAPVYQWQVNTGSGFVNVPVGAPYNGQTTNTLTVNPITAGMAGYLYRCVISNTCTAPFNSSEATLLVGSSASITSHPSNSTICTGASTSFSITASGAAFYRWQVNTGSGFVDVPAAAPYSGNTTATLTINPAAANMSGYQYRCAVGSCSGEIYSNTATLTISIPVSITTHPATQSVCEGATINLSVATTGTVSNYQWQVSLNSGGLYTNIAGATTSTFSIPALLAQNGYYFRVVVTGSCGPVNSNAAILTVNPMPVFTISLPAAVCVSDPSFSLNASVAGGVWSGAGVSGSTFNPATAGIGQIPVTYTLTALGCTKALTASVSVNACTDRHVLLDEFPAIYLGPNPTETGRFTLYINTDLYSRLDIKVFNSAGQLVQERLATGIGYGSAIPVDLSRMASGVYHLYLANNENGFISRGMKVIIQRR